MRKLHIHGLWLVLQIISTTQGNVNNTNPLKDATSRRVLSPTPSIVKYLDKQTDSFLYEFTTMSVGNGYTGSRNFQSSELFRSRSFSIVFKDERTLTQSGRNLFNKTQSWRLHLHSTSTTENVSILQPSGTQLWSKTTEMDESNSNSFVLQNYTTKVIRTKSKTIQYTEGATSTYSSVRISNIHDRKSSSAHGDMNSTMNGFQSQIIVARSSYIEPTRATILQLKSSSRSYDRLESSFNDRFQLSTLTLQPSEIVTELSRHNVFLTEKFSSATSYSNKSVNSEISPQCLISKSLKTSKIPDTVNMTSSHGSSPFSRHGNNAFQTRNKYLSSLSVDLISRLNQSKVETIFANISQTFLNKGDTNTYIISTQKQSSSKEIVLESVHVTKNILSSSPSAMSELSLTGLTSKTSSFDSRRKSSEGSDYSSQEIISRFSIVSTHSTVTSRTRYIIKPKNTASDQGPGMPVYVLAICLPVAALLGFTIAFVYFKRNKEDHRVRYSVTVEISAEKPDYELKRMYSIIDVSAGINKDFLSGLESRKASKDIADELDTVSYSTVQRDRNV